MIMVGDKTYVELTKQSGWTFTWNKDWLYYKMFLASEEHQLGGTIYRCAVYNNQEDFFKSVSWERIDSTYFLWIKERGEWADTWLSGMLFMEDKKQSFFVNLYDNKLKQPGKEHDKLLILKEAEWREKKS